LRKFPRGFLWPGGNPPQKRPRPENSPAAPVGAIPKRKRERRNERVRHLQAASAENPVPGLRQNPGLSRRGAFFPPPFSDANAPENGRFPNRPYEKTTTVDCPRHQWEAIDGTQECVPYGAGAGFPGGERPILPVASETEMPRIKRIIPKQII